MVSLGSSHRICNIEEWKYISFELAVGTEKLLEGGSGLSLQLGITFLVWLNDFHAQIMSVDVVEACWPIHCRRGALRITGRNCRGVRAKSRQTASADLTRVCYESVNRWQRSLLSMTLDLLIGLLTGPDCHLRTILRKGLSGWSRSPFGLHHWEAFLVLGKHLNINCVRWMLPLI